MEVSTLKPIFDDRPMEEMFDWDQRQSALVDLRKANFERLLDLIEAVTPAPARLLDVGCAEGWFLEAAQRRGYKIEGIEPDQRMAEAVGTRFVVRNGFFPEVLSSSDKFDVITFNDVFEHLPDVNKSIAACHRHLTDNGILVFNLPNALGGLYRISRLLKGLGFKGPFSRMWQENYPSPHLTYFNPVTLRGLAVKNAFEERLASELPPFEMAGLWSRIRCDRTRSLAYSAVSWAGVMGAVPLLKIMPSDIIVQMFGKSGNTLGSH
jgi:SAM-dependent methyltransferase